MIHRLAGPWQARQHACALYMTGEPVTAPIHTTGHSEGLWGMVIRVCRQTYRNTSVWACARLGYRVHDVPLDTTPHRLIEHLIDLAQLPVQQMHWHRQHLSSQLQRNEAGGSMPC